MRGCVQRCSSATSPQNASECMPSCSSTTCTQASSAEGEAGVQSQRQHQQLKKGAAAAAAVAAAAAYHAHRATCGCGAWCGTSVHPPTHLDSAVQVPHPREEHHTVCALPQLHQRAIALSNQLLMLRRRVRTRLAQGSRPGQAECGGLWVAAPGHLRMHARIITHCTIKPCPINQPQTCSPHQPAAGLHPCAGFRSAAPTAVARPNGWPRRDQGPPC